MKHSDFIFWLKGFVTACNSHMPTPAQWDMLKDKLDEVKGAMSIEDSIDVTHKNYWTTNTTLFEEEQKIF